MTFPARITGDAAGAGDGGLPLDLQGERLHLLPERAIWWPAQGALLVADVHIGKAATFRALGQPVPAGTTMANLQRLETLVRRFRASSLIVLGDFLHAPQARSPAVLAALSTWRERMAGVSCLVIEGNHDRHAGRLPDALGMERISGSLRLGAFLLTHGDRSPEAVQGGHPGAYALAGHLHPAYVLRGRAGERLRLPCFVFGAGQGVLPAFGEFTGSLTVAAAPSDRIFVVGGGKVWAVPPPQARLYP